MELATKVGGVGGRADFSRVVLPLQPNLMRVALGLTRNAAEASDLVQDALERALREWDRFAPGANARAWVTAILSRLFIGGPRWWAWTTWIWPAHRPTPPPIRRPGTPSATPTSRTRSPSCPIRCATSSS